MNATLEVTRRLHQGVITALVHVTSVRTPGAAALAIEFDAAHHSVMERARSLPSPDVLKSAFSEGLSLQALKAMVRDSAVGDRRLLGLKHRELIDLMDAQHRAGYRELVLDAARAALLADIEERLFRFRRLTRWERRALQEIETVFASDGWSHTASH